MSITALIEQLARLESPYNEYQWQGWHIRPLTSGNNLLFRTTCDSHDLAVKFMIRDKRNRAQREFSALTLIDCLGSLIGPRPLYIDQDSYQHAVVVQTWVDGTVFRSPPTDDSTWLHILQTYSLVHHIQPADALRRGIELDQTVSAMPPAQALTAIRELSRQVPPTCHTQSLAKLIQTLDQIRLPAIRMSRCWCHGDPSIRNMIVTSTGVQLVDWEYSGMSDPAQEIAMLMSHPFARPTGEERWQWVAEQYAQLSGESDMLLRIQVQYALRLAWWCVRLLLGRYVLLQRPSQRLVGSQAEEEISTLDNINHYFSRAQLWLSTFT